MSVTNHRWGFSVQRKIGKDGEPVAANRFVLKHHQVGVDYTFGATPGILRRPACPGPGMPDRITAPGRTSRSGGDAAARTAEVVVRTVQKLQLKGEQ